MLVSLLLLLAIDATSAKTDSDTVPAGNACRIKGTRAALELVVPRGLNALEQLWIEGHSEAEITADHDIATVHFSTPLVLETRVSRTQLSFRLREPIATMNGRVRVGRGFRLEALFVANGRVGVRVPDSFSSRFPLANNEEGVSPTILVDCDNLEMVASFAPEASPISTLSSRFGAFVPRNGEELLLYPDPSSSAQPVALWAEVRLERLDVRGDWTRVRARWTDGTRISGWTNATLQRANDDFWFGDGSSGCGNSEMEGGLAGVAMRGAGLYSNQMATAWATFAVTTPVRVMPSVPGWYLVYNIQGVFRFGCGGRFDHFPIGRIRATDLRRLRPLADRIYVPVEMKESL